MTGFNMLKAAMAASVSCLAIAGAAAAQTVTFEIPPGDLKLALDAYARQAGIQLIYRLDDVRGRTTAGVRGSHSPEPALARILAGSGLTALRDANGAVVVAPPQSGAGAFTADQVVQIGEVVVTASRIDRAGFEAPTPTVRLSAEELRSGPRNNIAAALNDLPQFRATVSPQTTNTNTRPGEAPVELRGLEGSRTLTLLDGRRFVGDNDLNVLPMVLVKGVDIVTGGASAAWGSGAVAGVVNVNLDRNFVGLRLGAQAGISSRGDGVEQRYEFAIGRDFAGERGHFVLGAEYLDNEGVGPISSRENLAGWSQISNGAGRYVLSPNVGMANADYGGLIVSGVLAGYAFNPDGSLRQFDYGTVVGTSTVNGGGPTADDWAVLVTPQRRYNVLAGVTYDLTPDVKLTAELRHSRMWNEYIWFGDHNRGNLTISVDNAFLPTAVRDAMTAAGQTSFRMGRFNSDFAYGRIDYDRQTLQGTLALDGTFANNWRWSAYYSRGEYTNDIDTPGFRLTTNYAQAVDSVIDPVTGNAICRVALTDPTTGCVPINLFGDGSPSAEAIAYVTGTPTSSATTTLDVGGFSVRGEPFSLPAGPVSVAFGAEARREEIKQTAGDLDMAGAFTTFSFTPLSGSYDVKEAFVEFVAPIVVDQPVLRRLEFNVAARISDYNTSGSIWSWKLGATNEFFEGFRGRITQSRDIRAANLTEMYTQATRGYTSVADPFTGQSISALTIGGGNATLTPEEADTFTAGFIYSPPKIGGLTISIDYYDISIDNVITSLSVQDTVTRCYNGNADLCSRITRASDGSIESVLSSFVNLSRYETNGIDLDILYTAPLDRFVNAPGRLKFRGLATWVDSLTTDDGVSRIEYVESQGYSLALGVPRLRVVGSAGYESQAFDAGLRVRYISAGEFNRNVDIVNNDIDAYAYVDLNFAARLPSVLGGDAEIYGGVSNLFDKDPPVPANRSPFYDVIGRYYTLGVRARF